MPELHVTAALDPNDTRASFDGRDATTDAPGVGWMLVVGAVALVAIKPFLDIPGEKSAADKIDLGMLATVAGAALMIGSLLIVSVASIRLPARVLVGPAVIAGLLLLSLVNMVAALDRSDLFAIFALPKPELFGPYKPPAQGMTTEAVRLLVTFAPVFLLATFLVRQSWVPERYIRWTIVVFMAGSLVHCMIAWLQVAGL